MFYFPECYTGTVFRLGIAASCSSVAYPWAAGDTSSPIQLFLLWLWHFLYHFSFFFCSFLCLFSIFCCFLEIPPSWLLSPAVPRGGAAGANWNHLSGTGQPRPCLRGAHCSHCQHSDRQLTWLYCIQLYTDQSPSHFPLLYDYILIVLTVLFILFNPTIIVFPELHY